MFGIETIELQYDSDHVEDVLRMIGSTLYTNGFVKDTYIQAVLEREKIHPTGLPLSSVSIAIPHTDPIHVYETRIAVATLKEPVPFSMMGNPEVKLPVQIVFMLAIKEPKNQVHILKQLIKMFQNEHILKEILSAQEKETVKELLDSNIFISN
jgi:PTS system galactitol-specific IIA component